MVDLYVPYFCLSTHQNADGTKKAIFYMATKYGSRVANEDLRSFNSIKGALNPPQNYTDCLTATYSSPSTIVPVPVNVSRIKRKLSWSSGTGLAVA